MPERALLLDTSEHLCTYEAARESARPQSQPLLLFGSEQPGIVAVGSLEEVLAENPVVEVVEPKLL
jgi:hypothetical protein